MERKKITDCRQLAELPIGYRWESVPRATGYIWTLLFGFLTKDLNPLHILPFSSYRSRFAKRIRHGISVVAQAEAEVFEIFDLAQSIEVVAWGYEEGPRYLKPSAVNDKLRYVYTLASISPHSSDERVRVAWRIEALDECGNVIMTAVWKLDYINCKPKMIAMPNWLTLGFRKALRVSVPQLWEDVLGTCSLASIVVMMAIPIVDPLVMKYYEWVAL